VRMAAIAIGYGRCDVLLDNANAFANFIKCSSLLVQRRSHGT
jgi:hypothetical protein